jgi:lysophospholipase L1-like esterase
MTIFRESLFFRSFLASLLVSSGAVATEPDDFDWRGLAVHTSPIPNLENGSRLVFIGDSITDMKWGRNESDRNHYLGHSFVFLLAARLGVEMPDAKLQFFNRGNSGNKVSDLSLRWQRDVIDLKPDVLTILIGANDVGIGFRHPQKKVTPDSFQNEYHKLLEACMKATPQLKLVLMDPFVLPAKRLGDNTAWRSEMGQLRNCVKQLAEEFGAVHVRLQDVFDAAAAASSAEQWIWDGIHPLPPGHELIARHWLLEVCRRWPVED